MSKLKPYTDSELLNVMDIVNYSSLVANNVSHADVVDDPSVVEHLAMSLVSLARQNQAVRAARIAQVLAAVMTPDMVVVERNGVAFGIITGGKA